MHFLLALMVALFSQIDASQNGLRDACAPASITNAPELKFFYDAADSKDRRRSPKVSTSSEDVILDAGSRSKVIANSRDIIRNYSIAGWGVRRHLDYVASFRFRGRNGSKLDKKGKDLDDQIQAIIQQASTATKFDRAGRHGLNAFLRIAEARCVLDGDLGVMRLASGQVQGIESDRIKNPTEGQDWVHGVRTDDAGKALQYSIWKRLRMGGMAWERNVSAENLHLLGYYDRFDQIRGIAPIAPGLNMMRDTYENFDYALAKAKISQLLGFEITRGGTVAPGIVSEETDLNSDEESEVDAQARKKYAIDLGNGPWLLDMDPGDKVNMHYDETPSSQFQQFMIGTIQVALKALDLPYSFFDEGHTNFYGSRGAWMHYMRACESKRERLIVFLDWWTKWQLQLAILDGRLTLPTGMTIEQVAWEWVPRGQPWWDPAKEVNSNLAAIGGALANPERVCIENDSDIYDNIDAIERVQKYAKDREVLLSFTPVPQPIVVKEVEDA